MRSNLKLLKDKQSPKLRTLRTHVSYVFSAQRAIVPHVPSVNLSQLSRALRQL